MLANGSGVHDVHQLSQSFTQNADECWGHSVICSSTVREARATRMWLLNLFLDKTHDIPFAATMNIMYYKSSSFCA